MNDVSQIETNENGHNAASLLSVVRYYGEDATAAHLDEIAREADTLPQAEKNKFFDVYNAII